MRQILYETIHKADYVYPYLEFGRHSGGYHMHMHEETEILYMFDGTIETMVGDNIFTLKKGDICVIPPNQVHTLFPKSENNMCIMKMYPTANLMDVQLNQNVYKPTDPFYDVLHKELTTIFKENTEKKRGYELAVTTACASLTLLILRTLPKQNTSQTSSKECKRKSELIYKVNSFLENNYHTNFSLEDVACAHHYTKCYFSRLFKETTGMNFSTYCTAFRLRKSAAMLKTSDLSVARVAEACGFSTVRSFNRAFKDHYNCTPREYRF